MSSMVRFTLDGREASAPEGELLVHAAARHGVFIPTLCHDDKLAPYGGCQTNGPVRSSRPSIRPITSGPPAAPRANSKPPSGTVTRPSASPSAMPRVKPRASTSPSRRSESPSNVAIEPI